MKLPAWLGGVVVAGGILLGDMVVGDEIRADDTEWLVDCTLGDWSPSGSVTVRSLRSDAPVAWPRWGGAVLPLHDSIVEVTYIGRRSAADAHRKADQMAGEYNARVACDIVAVNDLWQLTDPTNRYLSLPYRRPRANQ